jgi:hypothetical protein
MEASGQLHGPGQFVSEKIKETHRTGDFLDPRANMEEVETRKLQL